MSEHGENNPRKGTVKRLKFMWNGVFSDNYDRDIDPEEYDEYVRGWRWDRDKIGKSLSEIMTQHTPPRNSHNEPASVLDIAAGTGIISDALKEKGYKVTALDLSHNALSFLKKRDPDIQTIEADMNQPFPFPEESFEAVTTAMGNRYIKDTKLFLENVYKVLKPGGVFIWPIFDHEMVYWKIKAGIRQHTNASSLAKDCAKTGFQDIKIVRSNLFKIPFLERGRNSNPNFIIARK